MGMIKFFLPFYFIKWWMTVMANRMVDSNDVWRGQQTWFSYVSKSHCGHTHPPLATVTATNASVETEQSRASCLIPPLESWLCH
eukprot:SAG11_NODE_2366_length_3456_cov_1.596068_7_plen_84_part_00